MSIELEKKVWELYLSGRSTYDISVETGRKRRWVQVLIKNQRAKHPESVVENAIKEYVKRLHSQGDGITTIKSRTKRTFNKSLSPSCIYAILGTKADAAKTVKSVKKTVKKCCKKTGKKTELKAVQKKFQQNKPVKAVCVTTPENKKAFKKSVKRLTEKIPACNCGTVKKFTVPPEMFATLYCFFFETTRSEHAATAWTNLFRDYCKKIKQ